MGNALRAEYCFVVILMGLLANSPYEMCGRVTPQHVIIYE